MRVIVIGWILVGGGGGWGRIWDVCGREIWMVECVGCWGSDVF